MSAADITAPELKTLVIPVSVDLSKGIAGLTIAGTAADDISGVKQLVVNFDKAINNSYSIESDSFSKNKFIGNWGLTDSWLDGSSTQTFGIAGTNANGVYNITSIDIDDVEGNRRSYSVTELKGLGINTAINFFGATSDITAPELKTLVIPVSVDLSKGVAGLTIAGTAADDISGVKQLVVNFDKAINNSYSIESDSFSKNKFIGNWGLTDSWLDGSSTQTFGIAGTNANGVYNITSIDIDDVEGNRRSYSITELKGLGINTSLIITDGTFVQNNLTINHSVLNGNIVLSLTAAQWTSSTNIVYFSINYDSSIVHFESFSSGSSGSYAVNSTNSEIGGKGKVNISASINNGGNNKDFIQLIFSTYEQKGIFVYDLSSSTINSENIANIYDNYSFVDTLPHKNVAPLGIVVINGVTAQNKILTVSNDLTDANGLGKIIYTWLRDGTAVNGETQSSYTLSQADVNKKISVKASYTDALGTAESISSAETERIINVNDAPTGTVSITGTPTQNQVLTASNNLADADGLGAISYIWLRDGTAINASTQSTYTLTQADVGKKITVNASYTDLLGALENVVSSSVIPVGLVNDVPTGSVTISGTAFKGQVLTASNNLVDTDGLGAISYTWLKNGIAIPNATQSTYKLTQIDTGQYISVKASYVDLQSTSESATSSTILVSANQVPTGTATIKGLATWGTTLSITNTIKDADGIVKLNYIWQNDTTTLSTSATYMLVDSDIGKQVWAVVSYTDKKGNLEEVKSNTINVTVSNKASAVNDVLTGTEGANKLNGLAGNDTLIGGLGKDILTGGVGADVFKFNSINDSSALPKQADTITDFKHAQSDKIDLSDIDANSVLPNDQAFTLISAATFSADATGQLRFDAKTSTLYGSTNADAAPEFAIVLSGVKTLVAEDLIL